jgi:hypothetical protein
LFDICLPADWLSFRGHIFLLERRSLQRKHSGWTVIPFGEPNAMSDAAEVVRMVLRTVSWALRVDRHLKSGCRLLHPR